MRRSLEVGALSLVTTLGCSCGAPARTSAPPATPPSAASAPADYEVHEWGLMRADPGDVLRVGAVAPPASYAGLVVEKPVLYFHATSPLTLDSVRVDVPDGAVTETWPFVALGASARWEDVAIDPTATCEPSALPGPTDPPCAMLREGDGCEASALDVVRTTDAACLTTAGTTERFLFYRARADRFVPPLRFERTAGSGDVVVTHEGDAPIPGVLVRIWSSTASVRVRTSAPPAPHASVTVTDDFDVAETPVAEEVEPVSPTIAVGQEGLRRTLLELGLTAAEANVFVGTWSAALFGRQGEIEIVERTPAPREAFVYFLPETVDDAVARLSFDPPPRAVRRALAVWSVLPASGSSH